MASLLNVIKYANTHTHNKNDITFGWKRILLKYLSI